MNIRYRPAALAQLDAIYQYIATEDPAAAGRVAAEIERRINALAEFLYSCPSSDAPRVRALSIVRYPYVVFYAVKENADEVLILRVRHTSQNPKHHLD